MVISSNLVNPKNKCDDQNCPFHGSLSVRGRVIEGEVATSKMNKTVIVKLDYLHYIPKILRYERRKSRIAAHNPPCLNVKTGDHVEIAECRPISKTVSFVVIERME